MRLVSLVPSITEALCMLGLEADLVGITDHCVRPADVVDGKARVGGTKDPDLKKIRGLRPDLVVANTDEQRVATLAALEGLGVDLLVTETDSLDEVLETWRQLGTATDREGQAEHERERIVRARDQARRRAAARPRLATLVPVWKDPWMATGGGTYVGDLLATCGFDNVLAGTTEKWPRIVLSTDPADAGMVTVGPAKGRPIHALPGRPDVVLLPTEPYAFSDLDRDGFAPIGAGREAVRVVDGELLTWWLSRTAEALGHFAALHETMTPPVRPG